MIFARFFLPFFCFPFFASLFRFLRFPTISCYGSGLGCFATRGRNKSIILKTADIQNSSRNLCFLYLLLPFILVVLGVEWKSSFFTHSLTHSLFSLPVVLETADARNQNSYNHRPIPQQETLNPKLRKL